MAGAMAACKVSLPLAHVEAGVRTGDLNDPFPEEGYRRRISQLATWHYVPSLQHRQNLLAESVMDRRILVTGNTVVDALGQRRNYPAVHGLVTLHRRESFGETLREIVRGVYRVARWTSLNIYWPVHPNPEVRRAITENGVPPANLILVPPMERTHFLAMLARAAFVLTDSGGVQEEAAIWGIPCIVARHVTDRQETVDSGHAYLMGENTPEMFLPFVRQIFRHSPLPRFTGYDGPHGTPSDDIADHLASLEGAAAEGIGPSRRSSQTFTGPKDSGTEGSVTVPAMGSNVL
jgi:UDP-N-acetylglucosamine 2-epimerase (non-hydrolysing)